jgi:HK97 family phage prohead protease
MDLIHKAFDLEVKSSTDDDYTFTGYGSTFNGDPDRYGDIVAPGAFAKSLSAHQSKGQMPALLWQHDMHMPIGVWEKMVEDEHGLKVTGRLTKGVQLAEEAYALLKDGALHSMSIGYIPKVEEYERDTGINTIKEVDLWEVSLVTIPANVNALVSDVKDASGNANIRVLEHLLRDAGLSRREAKALLHGGFNHAFKSEPDEEALLKSLLETIKS